MKAWLGNAAREPGDMDGVFLPWGISADAPRAMNMVKQLTQRIAESPDIGDIRIDAANISVNAIWTYERIGEGRRILFPWRTDGLPDGVVQMDVAFGERLLTEPVL